MWTETVGIYFYSRAPNRGNTSTTPYSERQETAWKKLGTGKSLMLLICESLQQRLLCVFLIQRDAKWMSKRKRQYLLRYDRYTDKIYWIFDLEKKVVEKIADMVIEDITDVLDQIFFLYYLRSKRRSLRSRLLKNYKTSLVLLIQIWMTILWMRQKV